MTALWKAPTLRESIILLRLSGFAAKKERKALSSCLMSLSLLALNAYSSFQEPALTSFRMVIT